MEIIDNPLADGEIEITLRYRPEVTGTRVSVCDNKGPIQVSFHPDCFPIEALHRAIFESPNTVNAP